MINSAHYLKVITETALAEVSILLFDCRKHLTSLFKLELHAKIVL